MSTVIGISFGNTTSSIAYTKEGAVEVIANPDGDRAIPSMLSYAHGDEFHGLQAKHQLLRNAANTIGYFRDYVGIPFEEIDVEVAERSAKPVKGSDGFASFEIHGEQKSVDEIVVRQFVRINEAARDYIGKDIDGVVLALPSDVPSAQKTKLIELAAKAGLKVVQVIGELSAALLAHVATNLNGSNEDKTFVVSDFGGTRSDAAVIQVNSGIFTVLATHSDHKLGGRLLDNALLSYLASEFENQYQVDPLKEQRAVAKLVLEAESLRKTLSNSTTAQFGIDSVASGFDFSGSLNRLKYEIIVRGVFSKLSQFVSDLLTKASLSPLLVDEVLLVGGVSWTPKVASTIALLFDEKTTKITAPSTDTKAIDPDELIARGCAIQGSLIAGLDDEELSQINNHLTGPHLAKSVGAQLGDKIVPVLAAHTLVPTKKTASVSGSGSKLSIVEIEEEVKTSVHKPEPKAETNEEEDDDESDWGDSEDEEYEVHERVYKATKTLAEVDVEIKDKADVTLYLTAAQKLQVVVSSGGKSVQGTI